MEILKFDDLPRGGFAGLREKRFVTDSRVFGDRKHPKTSEGLGNFVYLADANFLPNGETGLHPHHEIDVISVMVEGRISHAGSLEHGRSIEAGNVQVQRAGAEGFTHNEINPDSVQNQMIQLWVLPDEPGEPAGYRVYRPERGDRLRVYGGNKNQDERFYSGTSIDVVNLQPGQVVKHNGEVMTYLSRGSGSAGGQLILERTLIRSDGIEFTAEAEGQLILIYVEDQ